MRRVVFTLVTGEMLSKVVQFNFPHLLLLGEEGWKATKTNVTGVWTSSEVFPSPCILEAGKVVLEMSTLPLQEIIVSQEKQHRLQTASP